MKNKNTRYSQGAEDQIGKVHKCLDHGYVELIDYMGNDAAIEAAARVSYTSDDKEERSEDQRETLIRYLMRKRHSSPLEMCSFKFKISCPIFVWRQWIRHRTACLSGDTELHFDLPGGIERRGNQKFKMKVSQVFQKFQPTKAVVRPDRQGNPYFKRERVQGMMLRSVDESTMGARHTNIVDIWESGEKDVFRVTLEGGSSAKMSADHLCLTNIGWRKLKEVVDTAAVKSANEWNDEFRLSDTKVASIGPGRNTGTSPSFVKIDHEFECWAPVLGWENYYEVSDYGSVRRVVGGQGTRGIGRLKKITMAPNGHTVVSLNRPGEQWTPFVHRLVLEAFVGPRPDGLMCLHQNGNGADNSLTNLNWGTPKDNGLDRVRHGTTTSLRVNYDMVSRVEYAGVEMTYDLEVVGPHHNFSAGGIVVHNSVNEISGRYTTLPDLYYVPEEDRLQKQSTANHQGSGSEVIEDACLYLDDIRREQDRLRRGYEHRLRSGLASELARINVPVSQYTVAYWKMDLHNLLHFLSLRMDSHAQYEIRVFANAIANIVADACPIAWKAFQDYRMGAVTFSAVEKKMLAAVLAGDHQLDLDKFGLSGRETVEFLEKLKGMGFELMRGMPLGD